MNEQKKTRRERIDAALDAMGAAVEEISFAISFYSSGALDVQLIGDKPRCLDGIAAERGAEIYDGETSVVWNNERLCMDCACEWARDALDTETFRVMIDRFAEVFGFSAEEVYAYGA